VPLGETVSYGELAEMAGRPGAARAVGGAMARNPVPLFVPCHRVLAAGGRLGGFGGARNALDIKRWLLAHEAAQV
jgi:methylated-DNA-[protein]-cysteine S-methyltransferase